MAGVTEVDTAGMAAPAANGPAPAVDPTLLGTAAVALFAGGGLALAARYSAVALLVGVAVVQAAAALSWALGTGMPGRKGALVLAAMAAGGADTVVSVWPHGRLGALLAVAGLAVPVLYAHQLSRGAARTRIVESMAMVAALVLAVIALASFLQLRHELRDTHSGPVATQGAIAALGAALVVGCLVDLVLPVPRFDRAVPRGLLGLVASAAVGAAVGYLVIHGRSDFAGGRPAFVGVALGAVAGLVAVGTSFVLHGLGAIDAERAPSRLSRLLRPAVPALLPLCLLAPGAFLLCLTIRS